MTTPIDPDTTEQLLAAADRAGLPQLRDAVLRLKDARPLPLPSYPAPHLVGMVRHRHLPRRRQEPQPSHMGGQVSELHITPWKCPFCVSGLVNLDGERCHHCHGTGLTDQPCGDAERAPRPPAVMRTACADCAFRQGSPELEANGAQLPNDEPFFCHQGLPVSATGAYTPTAMFRGLPLGAMVCAGWWAMRTGEPLPAAEFREVPVNGEKQWGLPHILTGAMSDEQRAVIRASGLLDQQGGK